MLSGGTWITVFTDASYDHRTKVYGWAAWIKDKAGTTRLAGNGKDCRDCNVAESFAVRFALDHVLKVMDFQGVHIVVQSDSQYIQTCPEVLAVMKKLKKEGAKSCYFKKVKGHNGTGDPRSAVNEDCDRRAKNQMRVLRDSLVEGKEYSDEDLST